MGTSYLPPAACDIRFRRTGVVNSNGSVAGELRIREQKWPTMERGAGYTFVRKGVYTLLMCTKISGRPVNCLCFSDSPAISKHLIHDAKDDDYKQITGCIAPGRGADPEGVHGSADAMIDIFAALGGFFMWTKVTIFVENNIWGNETKDEWIRRREAEAAQRLAG
jgi:hypothetical protein